tara:strand:+ start:415 stop:918 length:504 start_codon:yes stop_codon:yes gene_type:complete
MAAERLERIIENRIRETIREYYENPFTREHHPCLLGIDSIYNITAPSTIFIPQPGDTFILLDMKSGRLYEKRIKPNKDRNSIATHMKIKEGTYRVGAYAPNAYKRVVMTRKERIGKDQEQKEFTIRRGYVERNTLYRVYPAYNPFSDQGEWSKLICSANLDRVEARR